MIDINCRFTKIGKCDDNHDMGTIRGHIQVGGSGEEVTMEIYAILHALEEQTPEALMEAVERLIDKDGTKVIDLKNILEGDR